MNKKNQILCKDIDLSTSMGALKFQKELSISKNSNNNYDIDYICCGEWVVLDDLKLEEVKEFFKTEFNLDEKKIEEILDESTFISA